MVTCDANRCTTPCTVVMCMEERAGRRLAHVGGPAVLIYWTSNSPPSSSTVSTGKPPGPRTIVNVVATWPPSRRPGDDELFLITKPDCPSDAFATAASLAGSRVAGRGIVLYPGVAVDGGGIGESTGIAG